MAVTFMAFREYARTGCADTEKRACETSEQDPEGWWLAVGPVALHATACEGT